MVEIEIERDTGIATVLGCEQTSRFRHDRMPIDEAVDRAMQRDRRRDIRLEVRADRPPVKIRKQCPCRARIGVRREQEVRDVIQWTLNEELGRGVIGEMRLSGHARRCASDGPPQLDTCDQVSR